MHVFFGSETSPSNFYQLFDDNSLSAARVLQCDEMTGLLLREADGREWWLTQPDMSCLGLLHGTADTALAAAVREWWRERSGFPLETFDLSATPTAAAKWVCGRLLAVIAVLGQQNKELMNQNRQLRRSYGTLQDAFSHIEHFVIGNHLHTPVLQYEPSRLVSFWTPEDPGGKLTQLLPVLSSRLSYFELNFRKSATVGPGELRMALRLEPAAAVLQEWTIPYANVLSGWNSFTPNPIVDEPNEVVLECTWSDVEGAPGIGLVAPHWETPYSMSAGSSPGHSVGVRIWSGLAGLRAPRMPNSPRRAGEGKPRLLDLPVEDLVGAREYKFSETIEYEYDSVSFMHDHGRLLVHPHGVSPTIAVLPNPVPEGILAISADTRALSLQAPEIEYAMAVLDHDAAPEAVFKEPGPSVGFSGWHRVGPAEARRITAVLERPAGREMLLYVATRLPPDSTDLWAWSSWAGIEFADTAPPEQPFSHVVAAQVPNPPDAAIVSFADHQPGLMMVPPEATTDEGVPPVANEVAVGR
jgi:hypothetical protein